MSVDPAIGGAFAYNVVEHGGLGGPGLEMDDDVAVAAGNGLEVGIEGGGGVERCALEDVGLVGTDGVEALQIEGLVDMHAQDDDAVGSRVGIVSKGISDDGRHLCGYVEGAVVPACRQLGRTERGVEDMGGTTQYVDAKYQKTVGSAAVGEDGGVDQIVGTDVVEVDVVPVEGQEVVAECGVELGYVVVEDRETEIDDAVAAHAVGDDEGVDGAGAEIDVVVDAIGELVLDDGVAACGVAVLQYVDIHREEAVAACVAQERGGLGERGYSFGSREGDAIPYERHIAIADGGIGSCGNVGVIVERVVGGRVATVGGGQEKGVGDYVAGVDVSAEIVGQLVLDNGVGDGLDGVGQHGEMHGQKDVSRGRVAPYKYRVVIGGGLGQVFVGEGDPVPGVGQFVQTDGLIEITGGDDVEVEGNCAVASVLRVELVGVASCNRQGVPIEDILLGAEDAVVDGVVVNGVDMEEEYYQAVGTICRTQSVGIDAVAGAIVIIEEEALAVAYGVVQSGGIGIVVDELEVNDTVASKLRMQAVGVESRVVERAGVEGVVLGGQDAVQECYLIGGVNREQQDEGAVAAVLGGHKVAIGAFFGKVLVEAEAVGLVVADLGPCGVAIGGEDMQPQGYDAVATVDGG